MDQAAGSSPGNSSGVTTTLRARLNRFLAPIPENKLVDPLPAGIHAGGVRACRQPPERATPDAPVDGCLTRWHRRRLRRRLCQQKEAPSFKPPTATDTH